MKGKMRQFFKDTSPRFYCAQSPAFGHLASTVAILKRFIALEFITKGEIVYQNEEVLNKLRTLLPQISQDKNPSPIVVKSQGKQASVTLTLQPNSPLAISAKFAITGGWEETKDVEKMTKLLNVDFMAVLQPYSWTMEHPGVEDIAYFLEVTELVKLDTKITTLIEMPYFHPAPSVSKEEWEELSKLPGKEDLILAAKAVVDEVARKKLLFCPAYGISNVGPKTPATQPPPGAILFNMCSTIRYLQEKNAGYKRAAVILVLTEIKKDTWRILKDWVKGKNIYDPKPPLPQFIKEYMNGDSVLVREDLKSQVTIANAIDDLKANQILILNIEGVPAAVFDLFYGIATLPSIFEGAGTAGLVMNLGKPYFRFAETPYPVLPFCSPQSVESNDAKEMVSLMKTSLQNWSNEEDKIPPRVLAKYFQDCYTSGSTMQKYFDGFAQELQKDNGPDKLLCALSYLFNSQQFRETYPERLERLAVPTMLAADDGVLDKLYRDLNKNLSGGTLNVVPGVFADGQIARLYKGISVDGKFLIAGANVSPPDSGKLVVTGTGSSLDGLGGYSVNLTFTEGDSGLTSTLDVRRADREWNLANVPWFSLQKPQFEIVQANSDAPTSGSVGSTVKIGNTPIEVALTLPIVLDRWVFQATFPNGGPSISSFAQLLGGIDLIQLLPPPVNAFTDLTVQHFEIMYDGSSGAIGYFTVEIGTTQPWPLFGNITLGSLKIRAFVTSPGDLKARTTRFQVMASFPVGPGSVSVQVSVPGPVFSGELVPPSDPLKSVKLSDVAALFLPKDQTMPISGDIGAFAFDYNQRERSWGVSCDVQTNWPVPSSDSAIFTITDLGFAVQSVQGAASGRFTGSTVILPKSRNIPLAVSAAYAGKDKGWTFDGRTTKPIRLSELLNEQFHFDPGGTDYNIDSLALTINTADNSWVFEGTASDWKIDFLDVTIDKASLKAGYNGGKNNALLHPALMASSLPRLAAADEGDDNKGYFADIEVDTTWLGMNINASVKFATNSKPQWEVALPDFDLYAEVAPNDKQQWMGELGFTENVTLGSMIETMVSWITGTKFGLEAPWDILNDISLSGLKLNYNFTTKNVTFKVDVGPIDLGIMRIDSIDINYTSGRPNPKDNGLMVSLTGSFPWNVGDDANGDTKTLGPWDASQPGAAPAPPGGGNKYFDLRLLALGQHVTVPGLIEEKNIKSVIEKLENLDIPKPPDIPLGGKNQPIFDATSSWFIAFDFGVLKVEEEKKKNGNGRPEAALALPDYGGDGSPALVPADDRAVAIAAENGDEEAAAKYFVSLSVVFNDPYLYGLRLGLDGPMAKVFAGLDFQIMYQQVSKNVGRYSAEIALPEIMRKIQVGVASITLPTFGIEIYTNGDFQVDLGFPWKEDFSLSFSIEMMAGPIPVLGSAGLYFGKLSSATTDKVPQTTKGWFNPIIVFGFGAQIGLGKSIEAGILKAGFSLTVFGIVEGVIARWLPYEAPPLAKSNNELQDGYYFSLTGTMGVQGRLYGSISFAIISAELNVEISIYVRITFASYEPIPITAKASVDVTLTVKIDLGLFSISIHLGFKASVQATFVLDNPLKAPAPWALDRPMSAPARLAARSLNRALSFEATEFVAISAEATAFPANWDNLEKGTNLTLSGWVVPVLTVAGDAATKPDEQKICYVVNFFLEGKPPIQTSENGALGAQSAARGNAHVVAKTHVAHAALERARSVSAMAMAAGATDKFEDLAIRVLQWVIAAGQVGKRTPDEVNGLVVSDDFLASALSFLSGSTTPTPIPVRAIERFLNLQTEFVFSLNQDARKDANGKPEPAPVVFFPAVPGLTLDVPAFAGSEEYKYAFGDYNSSSAGYLDCLNTYFNQLKIQVQEEQKREGFRAADAVVDSGPAIATYIFGDYFAMIGRLMIQAMRDGLRNYKLVIADCVGNSVQQIVDDINSRGNLTADSLFTVGELFVANQKHTVTENVELKIVGMKWQSAGGKSFNDIAKEPVFKDGLDATALALENAANATIIAPGIKIVSGQNSYTTQGADSLNKIASNLGFVDGSHPDVAKLIKVVPTILTDAKLLASQSILDVPWFSHSIAKEDTLQMIGGQYGIDLDALANANGDVKNLFDRESDPNLNIPHLVQYQVGALIDEMKRTLALQHVSAMVSRYYLHGLRLPTRFKEGNERLTPNANGLFVQKAGRYPEDLGLYALTGQAFPLPDIPDPSKQKPEDPRFSFSLTRGNESWLSLGVAGGASLTFTLDHDNDYLRYDSVKKIALSGFLNTQSFSIKPLEVAATKPGRYPLSREIPWQPAVVITLPNQKVTPSTPRPRLWSLPSELINIPSGSGVHPTLKLVLARTDESKGITVDEDVNNYGFGTLITFTVKKIQAFGSTGITQRTYEIIGAPESEITLLERLLDQLKDDAGTFDQVGLFYRPSATGSEAKGWQSDSPVSCLMAITQTNLSTETRPPALVRTAALAAVAIKEHPNLIGTPNEFLRLLWEANITRQGGFYLSYTTGIGGDMNGLPDHAFNDRGEAEVAVFALFTGGEAQGQALSNYMNVAVTNEPFELSHAALIAEVVPVAMTKARNFAAGDTLASYALSYYTVPGVLAEQNANVPFNANVRVTIEGGVYQVPPKSGKPPSKDDPGGDLSLIAEHFNTSVGEIKKVNAAGDKLPDQLDPYTAIKLPPITTDAKGNSFDSLSQYYNAPIPEIAAANFDVAALFPEAALSVITGPVSLAPGVKQGIAGTTLERPAPNVPDTPSANWGEEYLRQNFSLLGYRVADNAQNHYFPESNWGLPSGPINPNPADDGDKIQAPLAPRPGEPWHFSFAVPYASVFASGQADAGPYSGVGSVLQFDFAWLDIFGNRILSDFDNPQPSAGTPLNRFPQITGYTDRLLGVGQWPSAAHTYRIIKDLTGKPSLEVRLHFDTSIYRDAAATKESGTQKLKQAIAVYTLIVQQLNDPAGVAIRLATTLTPSANWVIPDKSTADQQSLKEWAEAILDYLEALLDSKPTPSIAQEYTFQVPLDSCKINTDQIFKLSTTLTLSRNPAVVAGELATAPGIAEAATRIAPWTGPLTSTPNDSPQQRTLTKFAKDFTDAFASVPGFSFRIATGSDRNVFTDGGKSPLWVVQLGEQGTGQPISYRIKDVGKPTVFAPRPISNVLKSKAKTPIIEYKPGEVIKIPKSDEDGAVTDMSFSSIDLDKWMRVTLAYIDELLTPKYVSPAEILRKNIKSVSPPKEGWKDALQEVLDAKKALAEQLKELMEPVYEGDSANLNAQQLEDIREVFYQSMLGKMGQFYAVKAGIQFEADVQAAIKQQSTAKEVPKIYGDIVMNPIAETVEVSSAGESQAGKSNISVSSPKLDLKFADNSKLPSSRYLSSLISSTTTDAKKVTLNLGYNGQFIEHEIGALDGIEGYKPSSWLSFVDISADKPPAESNEDSPLRAELGQFDVPIVLREFPDTPTLVNQEGMVAPDSPCYQPIAHDGRDIGSAGLLLSATDCTKTGTYDPLAIATRWNYAFDYSMQVHHQQDEIHGQISFNIVEPAGLMAMATAQRDLFDNLAQFTQVYPKVRADLNTYLAPIDVSTMDPSVLKNAQFAIESAAAMINWIAGSFRGNKSVNGLAESARENKERRMDGVAPIQFILSENGAEKENPDKNKVTALQVTVKLTKPLPARVGLPWVEIAGYTCERVIGDDNRKGVFFYKDKNGAYLEAPVAKNLPERKFVLPDLDILERQDAQTEIYLTRNADIVPGETIAEPFVYTTPKVSFESPLHPTLFNDDQINLATIFSENTDKQPKPVRRTLECQLTLFYEALFANAGTNDVTLQLSLYYEYAINPAIEKVRLPVYLMPPTKTAIRAGGSGRWSLAEVITNQAKGWETWFDTHTPETGGGRLIFDLTVMADLTARPMPILKMTGLYLPVADLN